MMLYDSLLFKLLLLFTATLAIPHIDITNDVFCEEDLENIKLCTPLGKEEISDPCKDANENCEFWARIGECKANPNYMLNSCAKSCKECTSYMSDGFTNKSDNEKDSNLKSGIDQKMFGTKSEMERINLHIQAMNDYSNQFVRHSSTTRKMRELCTNQLDSCAYYATKGLCESKNIFMMENCPLACMMCDKKQQFDECVGMRHPFSTPVFVTEQLYHIMMNDLDNEMEEDTIKTIDSFFDSFKEDTQTAGAGVETLDEKILRFDNFLSDGECNALIDLGKKIGWTNSTLSIENNKGSPSQSSMVAECSNSIDMCNDDNVLSVILKNIAEVTNIPLQHFEPAKILHYPELIGFHSFHQENDAHDSWKMAGPRVLTIHIPLSNAKKGGYLGFPGLDWLMIPSSQGQMILWSNVLHNDPGMFDAKMGNEILPVQEGDLYVLQIHVRQYNFETAHAQGCA